MPFLFKDYTILVLKAYEEKRDANLLSRLLMHPTTANIKQDCLNVYNTRINKGEKEEENILSAFFGVPPAGRNFGYLIERYSPDRFRPLQSFIKGEIRNPALATVELLAWLIDFTPRPLAYAQKILGVANDPNSQSSSKTDSSIEQAKADGEKMNITEIEEPFSGSSTIVTENFSLSEKDRITDNENIVNISAEKPNNKSKNGKLKMAAAIAATLIICTRSIYTWQQRNSNAGKDEKITNEPFPKKESQAGSQPFSDSLIKDSNAASPMSISLEKKKKDHTANMLVPGYCQAITKKGTQCKRKPKSGSDYCWQHGG